MKKFALALVAVFVLSAACGGGGTPDQVVKKLFEAFENADGDAVVACLSEEALEDMNENVEELRESPEESVAFFAMMNIEITEDEIENMTAGDLVSAILGSEVFTEEMPDFSNVEIGEAIIDEEDAKVLVTIDGDTEEFELVLEDGNWKIDDGMNFM
ncbi:MAG: DUF4829 domain-containing protein [Candidatus Sabulitectum sp.]|nr:DUF4829 domain-containing protein [Candidatus Sabulitectum sp.]